MHIEKKFLALVSLLAILAGCEHAQDSVPSPRTIVTCDPELDDNNSMIRCPRVL